MTCSEVWQRRHQLCLASAAAAAAAAAAGWCGQVRKFESVNFMDFAKLLAAFSDRADYEEKVKFIFRAYDVDGDGECGPPGCGPCLLAGTQCMHPPLPLIAWHLHVFAKGGCSRGTASRLITTNGAPGSTRGTCLVLM